MFPSPAMETKMKDQESHLLIKNEVESLLSKNAIRRVRLGDEWGFYSQLFLVPKPSVNGVKKWRPCINLRLCVVRGNFRTEPQ